MVCMLSPRLLPFPVRAFTFPQLRLRSSARTRTAAAASVPATRRCKSQLAYVQGPSEPPLLEQTVPQNFAEVVRRFGDRDAVISRHQNDRLTYRALDERSNALARGLESTGVRKGTRVAVLLGNNIEFAALTYACFKIGAILVPLNPAFTPTQVASALNHLESSHLIISTETNLPRRKPTSNVATLQELIPNLNASKVESSLVPSLRSVILVDNSSGRVDTAALRATAPFQDVVSSGGDGAGGIGERGLHPDDVVNIQFTSGTTSMPKAACLTHRSILNNGKSIGDRMLLSHEDVVVCPPPLFHCFGSILGYMACATHGAALVLPSESFDALSTLLAVQENEASALYGVPTMFLAELELLQTQPELFDRTKFQRLRTGIAAGSQIPTHLMKRLHAELGLTQLTICYGMTETSPVSAMTTTDDPLAKRVATVGRLLPHVHAKIVAADDPARVLERGARGELLVAGYLVMKEYWGDARRTAAALVPDAHGRVWMRTGDEAAIDEAGYVAITGRLKDIIIRGGENIHPLDVEDCLLAHPRVLEVCAFGVPDDRYGEVVAVCVVLRGDDQEEGDARALTAWAAERLPRHFVPRDVYFEKSLPKTPSGKIQRFKLREKVVKGARPEMKSQHPA